MPKSDIPQPILKYFTMTGEIVLYCEGKEMLRITKDGFYIDGEKIEDNKHRVYERFLEFLDFHGLHTS